MLYLHYIFIVMRFFFHDMAWQGELVKALTYYSRSRVAPGDRKALNQRKSREGKGPRNCDPG